MVSVSRATDSNVPYQAALVLSRLHYPSSPQGYWSPDIPLHQPGNSTIESSMTTGWPKPCYHLPRGAFRIDRNALDDALLSTQPSVATKKWIARLISLVFRDALARCSLASCNRRCDSAMVGYNLGFFCEAFCRRCFIERVKIATAG